MDNWENLAVGDLDRSEFLDLAPWGDFDRELFFSSSANFSCFGDLAGDLAGDLDDFFVGWDEEAVCCDETEGAWAFFIETGDFDFGDLAGDFDFCIIRRVFR